MAGGSWRAIGEAPGEANGAPVWTGDELVLWGGPSQADTGTGSGIAYRPASNRWREVAPSPLGPRSGHTGVWSGTEIVYWGGLRDGRVAGDKGLSDGAAYNPKTDQWRTLPRSPLSARFYHVAAWTGREMVIWGGIDQCCPTDSTIHDKVAAAYDPATNRWRRLADVPPPWSGDDGPAVTGATEARVYVWRNGRLGALDLRANQWHDLGTTPPVEHGETGCMVTGGPISIGAFGVERLVVWTGGCAGTHGAAYDFRTGAWSRLPAGPPDELTRVVQTPAVFGVTRVEQPKLMRLDGQTWQPIDVPRNSFGVAPVLLWTGTDVLAWGGYRGSDQGRTGVLFRPL